MSPASGRRTGLALAVWLLLASLVVPSSGAAPSTEPAAASEGPAVLYAQFGSQPERGDAFLTPYPRLAATHTFGPEGSGALRFLLYYPVHAALAEGNGRHLPDYRVRAQWDLAFVPNAPAVAVWHLSAPAFDHDPLQRTLRVASELVALSPEGSATRLAAGQGTFVAAPEGAAGTLRISMGPPARELRAGETMALRFHWWSDAPSLGAGVPLPLAGLTVHPESRLELPLRETTRVDSLSARSVMGEILVRGTVRHAFNTAFIDLANVSLASNGPATRGLVASPMLSYARDGLGIQGVRYEWRLPFSGASPDGVYEFTVRAAERGGASGGFGTFTYEHGEWAGTPNLASTATPLAAVVAVVAVAGLAAARGAMRRGSGPNT